MELRNPCIFAALIAIGGCATEGGAPSVSQQPASGTTAAASAAAPVTNTASPVLSGPVVFNDLPAFDRALSQSLSAAKTPVVVTSADRITLRQIPPRLEKWLAAVDAGGGKIETVSADGKEPQTRSLGLSSRWWVPSVRRASSPRTTSTPTPVISMRKFSTGWTPPATGSWTGSSSCVARLNLHVVLGEHV